MQVTVFGGTGFVGRCLVERLTARGAAVRVVSRRAPRRMTPGAGHLQASIEDSAAVARAMEGADAAVNLVGTTAAKSEREFYAMHRDAPRRMAKAARRAGTERFVLVSAMGAAPDAPSAADRSKAAGEQAVREELADAIIVRPALVYGPHDHFFARLAPMVQRTAAIPLIGGGRTRFQPIHVEDLADALTRALDDPQAPGRDYDLGAEEVFDLRGLIKRLCEALGRRPWLVPVPFALAELAARLPRAPLTLDQVRLLRTDKVARPDAARPAALCVAPRRLAPFLAGYHSRRE